tara:strand:- start:1297 stop:1731 length:435 start_codon:yes stop_codon:yes gene_type:complete
MNSILNTSLSGSEPASSINPPTKPVAMDTDEVLKIMEKYFKNCSYDCGKNYSDGFNVELMRDKLDATTLLTSLTRIVFESIRTNKDLSDDKRIELGLLFQSIEKQLSILRISDKNVACIDVLCKIIGYCMKNYDTYKEPIYDRQ